MNDSHAISSDQSSKQKVEDAIKAVIKDETINGRQTSAKFVSPPMKLSSTKDAKPTSTGMKAKIAIFMKSGYSKVQNLLFGWIRPNR